MGKIFVFFFLVFSSIDRIKCQKPSKAEKVGLKGPAAQEREPWHEEILVYSLLYGQEQNHYRTSVRPIDMAKSLVKLTDDDFTDKKHFVKTQCIAYENTLPPAHKIEKLDINPNLFKGKNCEDVLHAKLGSVSTKFEINFRPSILF